jgi:hypothetical protein
LQGLPQGQHQPVRIVFWAYWLVLIAGLALYAVVGLRHL